MMSFGKKDEKEQDKNAGTNAPSSGASGNLTAGSSISSTTTRNEAFLGPGSKVVGTLSFTGPVELDGVVEGEVNARELLTIGKAATVNAKINGNEVIVLGTVTGDITASKRLSIRKPAKVTGNLSCPNLSVEEGVVFEGKCTMSGAGLDAKGANLRAVSDKSSERVA